MRTLNYSNGLKLRLNLKILGVIIFMVVLSSFNIWYNTFVFSNYHSASESLPIIAQRDAVTLLMPSLVIDSIGRSDFTHICKNKTIYETFFEKIYHESLYYEEMILGYQKATRSIYNNYVKIMNEFNSDKFCTFFDNQTSKSRN